MPFLASGPRALHWLHAFGIVDNDRRTEADINRLKGRAYMPFGVFSRVDYYHPDVQRLVAQRHAVVTGNNASTPLTPKLLRSSNQAMFNA